MNKKKMTKIVLGMCSIGFMLLFRAWVTVTGSAASPVTGAIFTTDFYGKFVNANI